jgi:uracil-DNA glycosylase
MHASWKKILQGEFEKPYFQSLIEFVNKERREGVVFPPPGTLFNAFQVPYEEVKVLILGQDPYPNAGQAYGFCFSVQPGVKPPPSLVNIYKELEGDLGIKPPKHGCLQHWVDQGVFLLNAVLTVRAHQSGSHQGKGWEQFTDKVIRLLDARQEPVVFVLWGRYARNKKDLIDCQRHLVLEAAHPSPMSARNGFFGSRPFSQINAALEYSGLDPIDWQLPPKV